MATYKTIHTTIGLQKIAQAEATGIPINLVQMAIGDGNGNSCCGVVLQGAGCDELCADCCWRRWKPITAGAYRVWCDSVAAGSCVICVENRTGGALAEPVVLQYAVKAGAVA